MKKRILELVDRESFPVGARYIQDKLGLSRGTTLGSLAWLRRHKLVNEFAEGFAITDRGRSLVRTDLRKAERALRMVEPGREFNFYRNVNDPTGVKASSLIELIDVVGSIDLRVIEFHIYRGDIENWIRHVLELDELANEIGRLKAKGEELRSELYEVLTLWYYRLTSKV